MHIIRTLLLNRKQRRRFWLYPTIFFGISFLSRDKVGICFVFRFSALVKGKIVAETGNTSTKKASHRLRLFPDKPPSYIKRHHTPLCTLFDRSPDLNQVQSSRYIHRSASFASFLLVLLCASEILWKMLLPVLVVIKRNSLQTDGAGRARLFAPSTTKQLGSTASQHVT